MINASVWIVIFSLECSEALSKPQCCSASLTGIILIRLSRLDHYNGSDEWGFISLSVGCWQIRGRCNEAASSQHQSWLCLGTGGAAHFAPLSLIDLLSSRPSQCNSSHASWWGAVPAHRNVVGTRRTPCDRGNLCKCALNQTTLHSGSVRRVEQIFWKGSYV